MNDSVRSIARPRRLLWRLRLAATITFAITGALCPVGRIAHAQSPQTAVVTVDARKALATIPRDAFGLNIAVWDRFFTASDTPGLIGDSGATLLRYPGGSASDNFHWETHTATSKQYIQPAATFDAFTKLIHDSSTNAMITVNYGSNADGTAGGDPAEAASWVRYANVTKGLGISKWEIGNEVYGAGAYGNGWETDLHKDRSPTAYGRNALAYIKAMKAVDPSIKIGVALCAPGNWPDGLAPDWNSHVLKECGTKIDAVVVHWYAEQPGQESDRALLASTATIPGMVAKLRSQIARYCGPNASHVQIWLTETNSVASNPGKQTIGIVNALFLADETMTWLEHGVDTIVWWAAHNSQETGGNNGADLFGSARYGDYGLWSNGGSLEPPAQTPFPAFFSLQMLRRLCGPGDSIVASSSSHPLLAVHAVRRAGGRLAVMLVNLDRKNACKATINLAAGRLSGSGRVFTYGPKSSAIVEQTLSAVSTPLVQTVPAYSIVTVDVEPQR